MRTAKRPAVVVDGANIAYLLKSKDGDARLEGVMLVRKELEKRGYRPIIIVDAALRYHVSDQKQFDQLAEKGTILTAPAGTDADYFVLRTAQLEDAYIVTDDQYREYRGEFPMIEERRIPVMIVDGHVELYHLPKAGKRRTMQEVH